MPLILGKDGINKELKNIYIGVGGINKKINELYIGQDGVNRKIYQSSLFTLDSVPIDGQTRNFPSTLPSKIIEFDMSVSINSINKSALLKLITTIGAIEIWSEWSNNPEDGLVNDTYIVYYDNLSGYALSHIGSSSFSGHVKILIETSTIYYYVNNVLKYSKAINVSTIDLTQYFASKSIGTIAASYTNLIIK